MYEPAPAQAQAPAPGYARLAQAIGSALLAAAILLACCLIGIVSRPPGLLAALWPANAVMLGMMIRWPRMAGPAGWVGGFAGYVVADLAMGGALGMTLWLTLANLTGVFTGWTLFTRLEPEEQRLQRPSSVMHLFGICAAGSAAAALTGAGITTAVYAQDTLTGLTYWFIGELANYIIVLPVLLTWPGLRRVALLRRSADVNSLLGRSLPALALAASLLAAMAIGGPGAIFFPIPALLWCALTYRMFAVSLLTMGSVFWAQLYSSRNMTGEVMASFIHATTSIRLGITLLALAPLTVASINAARNRLLAELEHAAHHDSLSGALTRGAFIKRGTQAWQGHAQSRCSAAALMLCVDGFRQVDDQYGYWAGDRILQAFARQVRAVVREQDIFGRLGDEEFGLLLFGVSRQESLGVGERLRAAVENMEIVLDDGSRLSATITVGITWIPDLNDTALGRLLVRADAALHRAKKAGRNRVVDDEDTALLRV
ncbi:GGDEF domain-containing protein [Bordetella genomosp. 13]|uniref:GGDEF domain-containing protein n=1 Tax=Bordetella genomosp. 13 TaxID=463040 RepID=UPI0011A10C8F|nr:GGDEF domain-containing protein [Bordetella genomosp. 13]